MAYETRKIRDLAYEGLLFYVCFITLGYEAHSVGYRFLELVGFIGGYILLHRLAEGLGIIGGKAYNRVVWFGSRKG